MTNALEELIFLGKTTEEKTVMGKKVVFEPLNGKQNLDILRETIGEDSVTRIQSFKIKTLARAIKSINGKPITYDPHGPDDQPSEEKLIKQNEEIIGKWLLTTIDIFFGSYAEVELKVGEVVRELEKENKKNVPRETSK
jgi:hypothetical protein